MNDYDCGVYVLWDIHCLSHYGYMKSKSPEDITAWRQTLYEKIQLLDPYNRKQKWSMEMVPYTGPIIDIDSD